MSVVHCRNCGALQPAVATCGVCGASLDDDEDLSGRQERQLAFSLVLIFGGIVVAGTALLLVLYLIL